MADKDVWETRRVNDCEICILVGAGGVDPVKDNVDVEVLFDDGKRYSATFFTLENIRRLMERCHSTGECAQGRYFWASGMIIVEDLTWDTVIAAVGSLIENGEFTKVFERIPGERKDPQ